MKLIFYKLIENTNIVPISFDSIDGEDYVKWKCNFCGTYHMTKYDKFILKVKYFKNIRRKICNMCIYKKIKAGDKYGKITILEFVQKDGHEFWRYRCECGNEGLRRAHYILKFLLNGNEHLFSCGKCNTQKSRHTHYKRASLILSRCNSPKHKSYNDYGGRGIKCLLGNTIVEVIKSLEKIPGYKPGLQLDRVDNNGDYTLYHPVHKNKIWIDEYGNQCLGNLRWVSAKINSSNRRNSLTLESLASVGRPTDLFNKILSKERSKKLGWNKEDFERVFSHHHTTPSGKIKIYYFFIHKSLL